MVNGIVFFLSIVNIIKQMPVCFLCETDYISNVSYVSKAQSQCVVVA